MSHPQSRVSNISNVLVYDFSFEILRRIKAEGMTKAQLVKELPGDLHERTVYRCLENLRLAGLVFRFRYEGIDQWWANKKGISDAAIRLSKCAALIPEPDPTMLSQLARQNGFVAKMKKFFEIRYRGEMLAALRDKPLALNEIAQRISSCLGPSALWSSLQTLEKVGMLVSTTRLVRLHVGGYHRKEYEITRRGVVALEAFRGERPFLDILDAEVDRGETASLNSTPSSLVSDCRCR